MATGRIMSPELSFTSVLRQAKAAESQAKGTITKTEAEKALTQLTDHPHADGAERTRIVQGFLDSADAKALSPKAKEAFVAFIEAQGKEAGGQKATELKLEAARTAGGATFHLDMARGHVAKLLQGAPVAKAELGEVTKALDAAQKAIGDARKSLTGILKVADHAAKLADTELGKASSEIKDAKDAVKNLVATAKRGTVTKAQLEKVQDWLANPKAEIETARQELGLNVRTTRKFPSDQEDGGFNPFGLGGIGGATTLKFPSDNEDNQGGGAGPDILTTKKAPSDAEDAGGGPMIHPQKPGGVVSTMKAPSDNEDNNPGVDGPMIHPRKPDPKIGSDRLDAMRTAFGAAKNIKWHNSMPLGQRFESAEMMRERHPDGYQFDVMVPVGALTPTAPRTDPNKVDSFWIRRSGGFAGLTQYAGPFTIADAGKKADLKSAVADLMKDIQKVQRRATEELRWEDAVKGITIKGDKVEVSFDDRTAFDKKGIDRAVTDELKQRGVKADVTVVVARRGGGGGPSTEAVGEEGGGMATTMAVGEEGGGFGGGASTEAVGEEGGGMATTMAVGEEGGGFGGGASTEAVGEEGGGFGGGMATTMAVGEEGGGASTEAVGEE
jgi:hypothetical protein